MEKGKDEGERLRMRHHVEGGHERRIAISF